MSITRRRGAEWAILTVEYAASAASVLSLEQGLGFLLLSIGATVVAIPIAVGTLYPSRFTLWGIPIAGALGINSVVWGVTVGTVIINGSFALTPPFAFVLVYLGVITLVCAGIAFTLYSVSYVLRCAIRHEPATALAT